MQDVVADTSCIAFIIDPDIVKESVGEIVLLYISFPYFLRKSVNIGIHLQNFLLQMFFFWSSSQMLMLNCFLVRLVH